MTLLSNREQVLVTGGWSSGNYGVQLNTAEIYSISTGVWTYTSFPMPEKCELHTATLLGNGRILIAGGNVSNAYYYDANVSSLWIPTKSMTQSNRRGLTATLLYDGRVLIS